MSILGLTCSTMASRGSWNAISSLLRVPIPRSSSLSLKAPTKSKWTPKGALVLQTIAGEIRWNKPLVYQKINGVRTPIAGSYRLNPKPEIADTDFPLVGFQLGVYDTALPLVIDPVLEYSTYLGGSDTESGESIVVDPEGSAYVTGHTRSADFPTMDPLQPAFGGVLDIIVTKLNPAGSALVYSTYLGGSDNDTGWGIAVDSEGNAYVTGHTQSADFPIMNPLQAALGGSSDAFVAKLNPAGSALVYSTYLGGSDLDQGNGIALDPQGNAYVTGITYSTDFPTMNPLQPGHGGDVQDVFVANLNPAGSALVYSTYLGGGDNDRGDGIAVDSEGNAYVVGTTSSTDFPTVNPLQPGPGGLSDAFVAQLNPTGSALVYSTYLAGSSSDSGNGIAVGPEGNAYVTGSTSSTDFPIASFQEEKAGLSDAFVAKITAEQKLYFAQFGNGQGFTSDVVLTNPSATKMASGEVSFLDNDGLPLPVGIAAGPGDRTLLGRSVLAEASSVEFFIPPLGAVTISTDGEGPELKPGSAVVTASRDLGGVIRFRIPGIGIAGVGVSQPLTGFIIPVRRKAGEINTGVALHNTESQAVTVDLALRTAGGEISTAAVEHFQAGEEIATTTIEDFAASGHLAKFLQELFPGVDTNDFQGTLVVQVTGGKVAATALELGPQAGQFTTLPVTPLE